jgi:hypothetical protein
VLGLSSLQELSVVLNLHGINRLLHAAFSILSRRPAGTILLVIPAAALQAHPVANVTLVFKPLALVPSAVSLDVGTLN